MSGCCGSISPSSVSGGGAGLSSSVSIDDTDSPFSVPVDNQAVWIFADSSAGAIEIDLPANPSVNEEFIIKDSGGAADLNNITIDGNGNTIDGFSSVIMITAFGYAWLKWNGLEWSVVRRQARLFYGWGCLGVTTGATSFLFPGNEQTNSTGVTSQKLLMPFDGKLRRMRVSHGSATGATNVTYTLQVNGVDTLLLVVLNSGATKGTNLTDVVTALANDELRIKASHALGSTLTIRPYVIVEFEEQDGQT